MGQWKGIDNDDAWRFLGWSSWMDWIHHHKSLVYYAHNNGIQHKGMILSLKTGRQWISDNFYWIPMWRNYKKISLIHCLPVVLMQDANTRCSITFLGSKIHSLLHLQEKNALTIGYATFGRMLGIWGHQSLLMGLVAKVEFCNMG